MTMKKVKSKIAAIIGTVLFHLLLLLILLFNSFKRIIPVEEEGVEVMFGQVDQASGTFVPAEITPVVPPEVTPPVVSPPVADQAEPVISQDAEESVALQEKKKKQQEQKKQELQRQKETEQKEAEAKKIKQEEQRKIAEINKRAGGAFGQGGSVGSSGNAASGKGFQGSPTGNSDKGATTGNGGKGSTASFSLKGRNVKGVLASPRGNEQQEGTIEVEIVVSPEGKVLSAEVDIANTSIASATMRRAAVQAARQTTFTDIESVDNQRGTITYVYRLSR